MDASSCRACAAQVHGSCDTIRTTFRPVPLSWHWCQLAPPRQQRMRLCLLPLLDERGRSINPLLLPPSKRYGADGGSGSGDDVDQGEQEGQGWGRWDSLRSAAQGGVSNRRGSMRSRTIDELMASVVPDGGGRRAPAAHVLAAEQ